MRRTGRSSCPDRRGARSAGGLSAGLAIGIALAGLGVLLPVLESGPASPLRHLFALPVGGGALAFGALGGGLTAIAAVLALAPALFMELERAGLSAPALERLVTAVTLLVGGPVVGALAAAARRHRARVDVLIEVQRALAEEAPLPLVLNRLRMLLAARWSNSAVALVVRDGDALAVVGGERLAPASAAARVLETGMPVFVPDTGGAARPRRAFAVPLPAGGETVGALAVERTGELSPRERAALMRLGAVLALALENARLTWQQRRFTKELAARVTAATRDLQALDEAKSAFLATASHELRTPLAALLGFSELLSARRFDEGEVQRLASIIRSETERLARIVDDLLDLSRLERGLGPRLAPVPLAVAPALSAAADVFGRGVATHRIRVECTDGSCRVQADPDAFDRVVKNLVSNAMKYSPAGSCVTVSARRRGAAVMVTVADEGPGIPAEALPRVFEPYYRGPGAAHTTRGTGLGLAVVKALVEAHGGAVEVDSAPGRGTAVTFTLPAAA